MGYTGVDVFICHESFVYTPYRGPTQEVERDRPTLRRLSIPYEDASPQPRRPQPRRLLCTPVPKVVNEAQWANVLTVSVRPHVLHPDRVENKLERIMTNHTLSLS